MKKIFQLARNFVFGVVVSLSLMTVPVYAACGAGDGASFLTTFPTWYEYLTLDEATCEVKDFNMPGDIWKIALALIEILLRVAGMVALAYTIWGGFRFVLSRGNPSEAAKARQTIIDALIGLAIASIATVLVAFLGKALAK